jgi:chaperonin GroES
MTIPPEPALTTVSIARLRHQSLPEPPRRDRPRRASTLIAVNAVATAAPQDEGNWHLRRSNEMATFRPLHDRVLVKRVEAEEKTPGGIIIPDTAKEKPVEGEVLAVGPGRRDDSGNIQPLDVRVGDRVLFAKWSGTEVLIDGLDRLIMKESDVLGVIEDHVAPRSRRTA